MTSLISTRRKTSTGQLWTFINKLVDSGPVPRTESQSPPWFEPGVASEIDEETYWFFLELLPPRWSSGNWFAFGEGPGPLRLFWQARGRYFARQLTDSQTRTFCRLSGTSLDS